MAKVSKRIQNYRSLIEKRKTQKLKVKKGDKVSLLCGDNKGKSGEILKILRKSMRVIVKGINLHKKVVRGEDGISRFETVELPVHISNVKKI